MRKACQFVGISGLVWMIGCSSGEEIPRVDLPSDQVDLGVLEPGENPFVVKFTNGGRAVLRVEKVTSTCSCTKAQATPEVASGSSGEVRGNVSVQGGPGGAVLSLVTNEPGEPKAVRLKWFGKSAPSLLPGLLEVRVKPGETTTRSIEVAYPAGDPPRPIEFRGASGLPEGTKLEMISDDPKAITSVPGLWASATVAPSPFVGRATLRLTLAAPSVLGTVTSNCVVKVGVLGKAFDLPLQLTTRVDEGVRVSPERLIFTAKDLDSLKKIRRKAVVSLAAPGDRLEVVEKPSFLEVELSEAVGDSRATLLTVRVTQPPPAGSDQNLVLADPSGHRVSVPILIGLDL